MVRTRGSTAAAKDSPESSRSYSPSSSEQESRSESEGGAPSSSSDSGVAVNTFVLRKRRVAVKKVTMSTYDQRKKGEQAAGSSRPAAQDSPRRKFRRFRTGKQPVTEAVQGDEKFKQRFSVHRILGFKFNGPQVNWIHEAGHGNLLKMSEFNVPVKLVKWIMRSIDPMLREFRFDNKVIVFDRALVCKILGFENGTQPVQLSSDPARFEEFQRLRDMYRDGNRVPMNRCIEVMGTNNKETFLRSFMVLALGTVYCPGTGNSPSLKYLHNLHDVSKIKEFDWAGHIIDVLMHSVEHYQNLSREQLQKDHNIAGCLAIFAIAYMDHLDLPQNRGTHQVCYDLPRICNVSNEDFEFVMRVDMQRLCLDEFGRLPFRAATPYSSPPSTTEAPSAAAPHVAHDDDVQTSFADWLHPLGSAGPSEVPSFYEPYIKEMNEHLEHDIEELSKSLAIEYKLKCKAICQKRVAEMIAKISKASTSGAMPPGSSGGQGEASAADDAEVHIGAQGEAIGGHDAEVETGAQRKASGAVPNTPPPSKL